MQVRGVFSALSLALIGRSLQPSFQTCIFFRQVGNHSLQLTFLFCDSAFDPKLRRRVGCRKLCCVLIEQQIILLFLICRPFLRIEVKRR